MARYTAIDVSKILFQIFPNFERSVPSLFTFPFSLFTHYPPPGDYRGPIRHSSFVISHSLQVTLIFHFSLFPFHSLSPTGGSQGAYSSLVISHSSFSIGDSYFSLFTFPFSLIIPHRGITGGPPPSSSLII